MALREFKEGRKPNDAEPGMEPSALPGYARIIGLVGAAVGLVTLLYVPFARPEYGGLADRYAAYLLGLCSGAVLYAQRNKQILPPAGHSISWRRSP